MDYLFDSDCAGEGGGLYWTMSAPALDTLEAGAAAAGVTVRFGTSILFSIL